MRSRTLLLFGLAALTLSACGRKSAEENPGAQSPLVGSEFVADLAALHDTVAARAARGDTVGLVRILVNDSTYRRVVWPTTPAFDSTREEMWNFAIGLHKANSVKGLRRLLADIAQPESGDPVVPAFGLQPVAGGLLHYAPRRERDERGLRLFGSALCLEDGCQVLSYAQGGFKGGNTDETADDEGM